MTPFEMGRRDSAASRIAQGLPAKVGPENPDELARVVALVREGAENMRARAEAKREDVA